MTPDQKFVTIAQEVIDLAAVAPPDIEPTMQAMADRYASGLKDVPEAVRNPIGPQISGQWDQLVKWTKTNCG